jgi:hypothetical protein
MFQLAEYTLWGQTGMWVESYGTLTTDIYGLSTATAIYVSPAAAIQYPAMGASHPLWSFMHIEKRTVSLNDYGFCRATCEYAGFEGEPEPVEEWAAGVASQPIQSHPNFESFAGTPSSPNNDAVWVDVSTNEPTTDNGRGVFSHFAGTGPFAGVTSYLDPYMTKKVTQLSRSPIVVLSGVGHADGTLLKMGSSSIKRGIAYQNTEEWRSGGRRGINLEIY